MKRMKSLLNPIWIILSIGHVAMAQVVIDDLGKPHQEIPEKGIATHYTYPPNGQRIISENGRFKIISRLEKEGNTYELMYGKDWLMWLRSTTPEKKQLSLKFMASDAPTFDFLCDLYFLKNGDLMLALSNRIYGYKIIRFKKDGNQYVHYMQAEMYYVRGVRHNEKYIPKGIRFDDQGKFIIDFAEAESDIYEFTEGKETIMLNGKAFEWGKALWFKDGVPERFKVKE